MTRESFATASEESCVRKKNNKIVLKVTMVTAHTVKEPQSLRP